MPARQSLAIAALLLAAGFGAQAQPVPPGLTPLVAMDPPDTVLRYTTEGHDVSLMPWDIDTVAISESGGLTDIFLRLAPEAARQFGEVTAAARGETLTVRACDIVMVEAVLQAPVESGTIYISNTTWARAEALRALWQGRMRCDSLPKGVFANGH